MSPNCHQLKVMSLSDFSNLTVWYLHFLFADVQPNKNLDWEDEIRLIQEIIFYNFSVSSFVSSNAPHLLPSRLCPDHGQ